MPSKSALAHAAIKTSQHVFRGVEAEDMLRHLYANHTEISVCEEVEGEPTHWTVFGNGRSDSDSKAWLPLFSGWRGLKRDVYGIDLRDQVQHKMLALLQPPLTVMTVEDGLVALGHTRLERDEPHFYGTDIYCLRHARFFNWPECVAIFARHLFCDNQPYVHQGPATPEAVAQLWDIQNYAAKRQRLPVVFGSRIQNLRIRTASESRWKGKRAVCVIERPRGV